MSLPSGYTRLEYIESTGTQYIDTGVVPDANTKVECDFLAKTLDCGVFGARIDYNINAFTLFWSTTNAAAIEIGNVFFAIGSKAVVNKRCIVEMSATSFKLDGETIQTYSQTAIAPGVPIYIFWSSGASFSKLSGRVYGFKIYKNATAVRDFIPCKNASGVVGLWDNVNSTFYANAGTGTFMAGPTSIGTHKVLINGTEYEVKGGKCLVNGAGYDIQKGRTLIGGTGYDIEFAQSAQTYDPVFANNTWEQIIDACHNNAVPDTWNVADSKLMTINGTSYQIDIIGKNHDTYTAGGTAPLTFQLHDCYGTKYQMNSSNTNNGGYDSSAMHTTHLPAILALMPSEVQAGIKQVNKMASAGSQSATIETIACKLFLLSEIEIFGRTNYSKAGEGSQYAYYSAGNRKVKNFSGSAYNWWERSPRGSTSSTFCSVNSGGYAHSNDASYSAGVAFGFCF